MTCNEALKMMNGKRPDQVTRAQRASFVTHIRSCESCRIAMKLGAAIHGSLTAEEKTAVKALHDRDKRDPEFDVPPKEAGK